ncbi:hypothetical protein PG987_004263 [Apiospora arundinis]
MPPNAINPNNESASNQPGQSLTPTPTERSPRTPHYYSLCPREQDWVVKHITSPSLINGVVTFNATWEDNVISSLSIQNHDLSKHATDDLGSCGLASIHGCVKKEGRTGLQVSFCDSAVEVKDLGGYWLSHARDLVIRQWGKPLGRKIWRRQLRYKRHFEGTMSRLPRYQAIWVKEGRVVLT